jgi:hypothetical protein
MKDKESTSNKEFLNWLHMEIHALRLIPNYKATSFEIKLNREIAEKFESECKECKEKMIQLKYAPNNQNQNNQQGGFGNWFHNVIGGNTG